MNSAHALAAALLLLGLASCEVTTFQNPPVAELACDARLVGDWFSVPDSDHSDDTPGELELKIDKTCNVSIIEHNKDGDKRHDPEALHVGRDGAQDYAWLDYQVLSKALFNGDNLGHKAPPNTPASASASASASDSDDPVVPAGDVYVMRYSVHDKDLQILQPDNHAIAHRIIDGKLSGEVSKKDHTLLNRLTDKVTPEQLQDDVVFDPKPLQFTRDHPESVK